MVTDHDALSNLAENLQRMMEARQLTQHGLARLSGVQQVTISRIFRAQNDPSVCTVLKIADSLGVSLDALFRKSVERIPQEAS